MSAQPSYRERSGIPHIFSTRIIKCDISTIWWHTQSVLEEIEECFAILLVRFAINIVEAIL